MLSLILHIPVSGFRRIAVWIDTDLVILFCEVRSGTNKSVVLNMPDLKKRSFIGRCFTDRVI